jgi:hypothetical protein
VLAADPKMRAASKTPRRDPDNIQLELCWMPAA